ncbi:hypothetical protein TNCV_4949551 [Trichonephila clavipes]|nr:hypothetical protein TNCV_4949551 [Trichonephila clavipes]
MNLRLELPGGATENDEPLACSRIGRVSYRSRTSIIARSSQMKQGAMEPATVSVKAVTPKCLGSQLNKACFQKVPWLQWRCSRRINGGRKCIRPKRCVHPMNCVTQKCRCRSDWAHAVLLVTISTASSACSYAKQAAKQSPYRCHSSYSLDRMPPALLQSPTVLPLFYCDGGIKNRQIKQLPIRNQHVEIDLSNTKLGKR